MQEFEFEVTGTLIIGAHCLEDAADEANAAAQEMFLDYSIRLKS